MSGYPQAVWRCSDGMVFDTAGEADVHQDNLAKESARRAANKIVKILGIAKAGGPSEYARERTISRQAANSSLYLARIALIAEAINMAEPYRISERLLARLVGPVVFLKKNIDEIVDEVPEWVFELAGQLDPTPAAKATEGEH